MNGKTYVVITNAPRESVTEHWGKFDAGVSRVSYEYRHGAVGLVHPVVGEEFGNVKSIRFYGSHAPLPEEGDIAVLLHSGPLAKCSSLRAHMATPEGFFLAYLNPNEYTMLRGKRLPAVQKGVRQLYAKHDFLIPPYWEQLTNRQGEEALDELVRQHWLTLEAFDPTAETVSHLPLETSSRHHYTDEELRRLDAQAKKTARELWASNTKPPYRHENPLKVSYPALKCGA